MANNNENSPHKEELVKVDAEKEVIESSATQSESSKSGAKQKKSWVHVGGPADCMGLLGGKQGG